LGEINYLNMCNIIALLKYIVHVFNMLFSIVSLLVCVEMLMTLFTDMTHLNQSVRLIRCY
jgi:hypothetical protein